MLMYGVPDISRLPLLAADPSLATSTLFPWTPFKQPPNKRKKDSKEVHIRLSYFWRDYQAVAGCFMLCERRAAAADSLVPLKGCAAAAGSFMLPERTPPSFCPFGAATCMFALLG